MVIALLLNGCVSSPSQPVAWQQHQLKISGLAHWRMRSKFGYVTDHDSGSAWLDWEQDGTNANAHISGPFGAGAAQVAISSQGAILKQAGASDIRANSAGELTHYLFGWPFPIEQLSYWVRGLPAPGVGIKALTTNPSGLLSHLEQDGWKLSFTAYQDTAIGYLPGKITASAKDLRIKLLVKEWFVEGGSPASTSQSTSSSVSQSNVPQNNVPQNIQANGR